MSAMPLTWAEVDDEAAYEHETYTQMEELILSSGMIGPIPDKPVSEDQVFLEKYDRHLNTTTEEARELGAELRVAATQLKTGELRQATNAIKNIQSGTKEADNGFIDGGVSNAEDSDDIFGDDDDDMVTEMMRKRLEAFSYNRSSTAESSRRGGPTQFGLLQEVAPEDFDEKVKGASKNGLVVMLIHREKSPGCEIMLQLLSKLASKLTSVKFTHMWCSKSITNFPPEHCPVVMCYVKEKVQKQYVRLDAFHGSQTTADDIEWAFAQDGLIETELEEDPREAALFG